MLADRHGSLVDPSAQRRIGGYAPTVIYFELRAVKEKFKVASLAELVDRIQARRTSDASHLDGS